MVRFVIHICGHFHLGVFNIETIGFFSFCQFVVRVFFFQKVAVSSYISLERKNSADNPLSVFMVIKTVDVIPGLSGSSYAMATIPRI